MIPTAANYDFTNVSPASCIAGGTFCGGMCPRLEEVFWLEEAARTAECCGGFNPLTGNYPSIGAKSSPGKMCPSRQQLLGIQNRFNNVITVPYYDWNSLPSGIWNGTTRVAQYGNASRRVINPGISESDFLSDIYSARVVPNPEQFSSSMWPSRTNAQEYTSVVGKTVSTLPLYRSAYALSNMAGLESVLDTGARTMYRNGAVGNTPIDDWAAGIGEAPNPFFNETQQSTYTDNTVDYYRYVTQSYDVAYSRESYDWSYPVSLPPWTYTGPAPATLKQTTVRIMLVWSIAAAPLWRTNNYGGGAGDYSVRDKSVTFMIWSGAVNAAWFGAIATRTTNSLSFQFPAGQSSSIVKTFGDHITNNVLNPANLASTGAMGSPSNVTRVGYVARVECTGAVYVASVARRDIGS